jgi:hypothetical protein
VLVLASDGQTYALDLVADTWRALGSDCALDHAGTRAACLREGALVLVRLSDGSTTAVEEQALALSAQGAVSWSPDDARIALRRRSTGAAADSLVVYELETARSHALGFVYAEEPLLKTDLSKLSWSADGLTLALRDDRSLRVFASDGASIVTTPRGASVSAFSF